LIRAKFKGTTTEAIDFTEGTEIYDAMFFLGHIAASKSANPYYDDVISSCREMATFFASSLSSQLLRIESEVVMSRLGSEAVDVIKPCDWLLEIEARRT